MKALIFLPEAQWELDDAEWFSDDAVRFGAEVNSALADIVGGRVRPAKIGRGSVRRWILPRLPYSIIYDDRPSGLVVVAFAHHKQRPGYWRKRLKAE